MEEKVVDRVKKIFLREGDVYSCTAIKGCDYRPKTLHPSNCVRHVRDQHPLQYNALELGKRLTDDEIDNIMRRKRAKTAKEEEDATAVVRINRKRFVGGLIKLVTLHNCPFNSLQWEGLRDVIEPGLEAFNLHLNRNNMPKLVALTSDSVDKLIGQEVSGEMLSFKFDTTTKMNRFVLGIRNRFYRSSKELQT